jgi:GAF domain-containing protein
VVDLLVVKIERLPAETQAGLKLAACIGHDFPLLTLSALCDKPREDTLEALEPAVREGLILQEGEVFTFLHDRVQQAAYSLIPEQERLATHLRIGRLLDKQIPEKEKPEKLFEIVHHYHLGAPLITDPAEKRLLAEYHLRAGRRARASSAYRSAAKYLSRALGLLGDDSFHTDYKLALAIHLECAECEVLNGAFEEAARLCELVLERAKTAIDKTPAYSLQIRIHTTRMQSKEAIETGIQCLGLYGIALSMHPEEALVVAEIQAIRDELAGRRIEELAHLPKMADPEMIAVMGILNDLCLTAYFVSPVLARQVICRMVRISLEHGNTGASAVAYATFGMSLCEKWSEYRIAYRLGKVAYDLTEKHGWIAYKAQICNLHGSLISIWTQHVRMSAEYSRVGVETGIASGNMTSACLNSMQLTSALLVKGDPLEEVYATSLPLLDLVTRAKVHYVSSSLVAVQRFVQNMRGLTNHFSTFDGEGFDEKTFESNLQQTGIPAANCFYYVWKLAARFITGDYGEAILAAREAEELLWSVSTQILIPEYHYHTALTLSAEWQVIPPEDRRARLLAILAHEEKLRGWAGSCPDNFLGKYKLVSAEIARIAERDNDAMRLYDDAIRAFGASGFVQNEAIACELAARFYHAGGFPIIETAYLQEARSLYAKWGATGKTKQMEERYPDLAEGKQAAAPKEMDFRVEHLDATTAIKASQALSGEIFLDKLLAKLMRLVIEHAGAERCGLLLSTAGALSLAAEATVDPQGVAVRILDPSVPVVASAFPISLIHYVERTREPISLDDRAAEAMFAPDEYITRERPKSMLGLPIVRQGVLAGILYLENNLVTGAFTPRRLALLGLVAAQAAVSLENARLYTDLAAENTERKQIEVALREKLAIIQSQADAIRSLSAPIIEVWEGVLTMPIFGSIDGARAEQMMSALLEAVSRTSCRHVIIDLTGVITVDPETAGYLLKIVHSVKLLGAQVIAVGIKPDVAFAMVSIGADLLSMRTLSNLRQALLACMKAKP